MSGLKRCPGVDTLEESDGIERPSKRGSFEMETQHERKTEVLSDLFKWPSQAMADLFSASPTAFENFQNVFLNKGLVLETFYSGQDCAGQALHLLVKTLALKQGKEDWTNCVEVATACDRDPVCQKVLSSFLWGKAEHVFGDICERLPASVLEELKQIEKDTDAAFKEALKNQQSASVGHGDGSLPVVSEWDDLTIDIDEEPCKDRKEIVEELSERLVSEMTRVLQSMLDRPELIPTHGKCCVHQAMCPFHPARDTRPLLWVAGATCTDECPTGSRRMLSGKAAMPFLVFMAEVRRSQPDMFLHECTHLFNISNLEKCLGDHYHIMPYTRPRLMTWCLHKRHGLPLSPERLFSGDLLSHFKMGTAMEGDVFFAAPPKFVAEYVSRRYAKASPGSAPTVRSSAIPNLVVGMEALLSGGDLARIRCQESEELQRRGEDVSDPRVCLRDGIGLPSQTTGFCKVKKFMPSLLTRSIPWSYRWKRELIPLEAMGVMGVPVFRSCLPKSFQNHYGCPFGHLLLKLGDSDVRRLAGNGMSFQVMGVAFVAGLSSFQLRDAPALRILPEATGGCAGSDMEEQSEPPSKPGGAPGIARCRSTIFEG